MDDMIYREDAIQKIAEHLGVPSEHWMGIAEEWIKDVPSAQPEIIRCKDCKHSEHWYRDRRRCFLWSEDGVSVFDDGFCNYAERRRDEINSRNKTC